MTIAGFTSTGSKRPEALFGSGAADVPLYLERSSGCTVRASDGRDYLDFIMGLGAVALGYGDDAVNAAVLDAVQRGTIGALAPRDEEMFAADLQGVLPWLEEIRILKSGAEAVAAAVRIARTATGRDHVLGCGYHGWLDWCSPAGGVPVATRKDFGVIPFNDPEAARDAIRQSGDRLAAVVVEPVIDAPPSREWLAVLREETARAGAFLIFDEIKTAFRIALGGATEVWGIEPDLTVLGKAIANGYPLAVVGGRHRAMQAIAGTWISSTMATEFVSLAAARATIAAMQQRDVPRHLAIVGDQLHRGLVALAARHGDRGVQVNGVPQMCYLRYDDEPFSGRVAAACAKRGLLFKRTAYNFVSLAHDAAAVDRALGILGEVLATC